jgi:hypothetical protein
MISTETLPTLPKRGRGQPTKQARDLYNGHVREFCDMIKEMASTLEFPFTSRGWCYYLEGKRIINKNDFDDCQRLMVECRKDGNLPLNICADDETRAADEIDNPNDNNVEEYATRMVHYVRDGGLSERYHPYYFTDYQDYYLELLVEKIDLIHIFQPLCQEFRIPIATSRGWDDLNSRGNFMARFKRWEREGKACVMLYCGDHDPGGLLISDTLHKNIGDLGVADLNGSGKWSPDNLTIDRFGLNSDFIAENDLTWIDNLITGSGGEIARQLPDGRIVPGMTKGHKPKPHPLFSTDATQDYLRRFGVRKVEANALITCIDEARDLFRDTVMGYLDQEGIEKYNQDTNKARGLLQAEITRQLKQ